MDHLTLLIREIKIEIHSDVLHKGTFIINNDIIHKKSIKKKKQCMSSLIPLLIFFDR